MEDKEEIKVSLGTVIIIVLVLVLGIVSYYEFVKDNDKKSEIKNSKLSQEIDELKEEEINEDDNIFVDENIDNWQITNKDDGETSIFTSEFPKISFEFPRSWTISSILDLEEFKDWKVDWSVDIDSPLGGVGMRILKCNNTELDVLLSPEPNVSYSKIKEDKISNYNVYSREITGGDADYIFEGENIIIELDNNEYYYIIMGISNSMNDYSEKEFDKIKKYCDPIFNRIISTIKI